LPKKSPSIHGSRLLPIHGRTTQKCNGKNIKKRTKEKI